MNIGSKLILAFLLVTLLPTVLLALLTTRIISNSMHADAQLTINNDLKAAWMQYYSRAHQMQYGMLQASTELHIKEAIKEGDSALLRQQLEAWKEFRPHVDLWAIVDERSMVIASLNTSEAGYPLAINGLVRKAVMEKSSFISTEVIPSGVLAHEGLAEKSRVPVKKGAAAAGEGGGGERVLTDGLVLTVVTPVEDVSGSVIGVIVTGDLINNDTFVPDTFAETFTGSLVTIALGDVQVATNVVTESGERTLGHIVPGAALAEIEKDRGFRGETSIADKFYITAFDPIKNHEGKVIGSLFVGAPTETFMALKNENIKAILTIALGALLIAALAAFILMYAILRPVMALKRKAQLVSAGDLNISPGVHKKGDDEITDLAITFDKMVENLRDKEARISASQEELREQKNLIESIINSIPYRLYVLDRSMKIVVWNRQACLNCPVCRCAQGQDCRNRNFISHILNDDLKEGLSEIIESVFETGGARQLTRRFVLNEPSHREVYLRMNIFPILSEKGGPIDYVVWMGEDITKTKEMESSVIASEKLAAIGQLAAGMAHEVNNPLGGILNCLYNLKNKKLNEQRRSEYLGFMEDGITRVQNIVRGLLDFSQQHAPTPSLTDVNSMIEGIIPLFGHYIKGRDIRLVKNLGEGLPQILVDRHQIEQILVNLILNAIQAVDGDGLIEVTTRFEGSWYLITVSDNGCGIPAENVPKIFDPFFTTKGVGKGTGLGLSVSRGIIERHKGRIEVGSRSGGGTIFKVYLPLMT